MDSFSLLNYWRGAAVPSAPGVAATATAVPPPPPAETDDEDDGDEGPFFDLEFAMPGDGTVTEGPDTDSEEERDVGFVVSSEESYGGDGLQAESDELLFKGAALVPLEPESKPQRATALLKSATKFRVFLLGFKKPKSAAAESNGGAAPASPKQQQQSKFFIKFRVEEVPFASLFTRDGSSKLSGGGDATAAEEKKFTKEAVQRYLNKIKPHYIRVSRRYAEKLRLSGLLSNGELVVGKETDGGDAAAAAPESQKRSPVGDVSSGLRVARKRLGKSKSASSAAEAAQRRDDTLRQQQDGIQSAIAHCKRSFTAAAAKGSPEPPLVRSVSDPVRPTSGLKTDGEPA